jgi:uncharacterized cofD-like protein
MQTDFKITHLGIQEMYYHQKWMYKVLTIGGGSGQYTLLSGLRDIENLGITAVASMADNGGSTGRLRDELGVLPPGDVLKCLIALSPLRDVAQKIMLKTLNGDKRLQGHKAGNMLISMLSQYTGSFSAAIKTLSELLEVSGRVLPVTTDKATLVAELVDGTRICGESSIDIPQSSQRRQIKDLFLVPHHNGSISAYPPVIKSIKNSDYILIGPGDLFTSILASLIVPGIKEAIQNTPAKILYILNIMTKFGETHNYQGTDFVQQVERYLERRIDGIICNNRKPKNRLLKKYLAEKSEFVQFDKIRRRTGDCMVYADDLLDASGSTVCHDSKKLASLIQSIIFNENDPERIESTKDSVLRQFILKDSDKMPIRNKSLKTIKMIAQ